MDGFLRTLKARLPIIWRFVELLNSFLVGVLLSSRRQRVIHFVQNHQVFSRYSVRRLDIRDTSKVAHLCWSLDEGEKEFFQPFTFTVASIRRVLSSRGYLFFGLTHGQTLSCFFFLRLFANGYAYLGLLVAKESRGRKLANSVLQSLAEACKSSRIALRSTVSAQNVPSWKAHERNGFVIIKRIAPDYYLLESPKQETKVFEVRSY